MNVRAASGARILEVWAYWRNDQEDGIAVGMAFNHEGSGWLFADFVAHLIATFHEEHDLTPDRARGELLALARVPPEHRTPMTRADVISRVSWMQAHGHLEPDEYNGTVWEWLQRSTGRTFLSEDNPVTFDVETAERPNLLLLAHASVLGAPVGRRPIIDHHREMARRRIGRVGRARAS